MAGLFRLTPLALLVLCACGKQDALQSLEQAREQLQQSAAVMQEKVGEWAQDFDGFDAEIERLRAHAATLSEEGRAKLEAAVAQLESQREDLHRHFENASNASQEAWGEVSAGFENAWAELQLSLNEAKQAAE